MIFPLVRNVLKGAYVSGCTALDATASAAFVAGIFLVSIVQVYDWARFSTPATHCYSTYITNTNWT